MEAHPNWEAANGSFLAKLRRCEAFDAECQKMVRELFQSRSHRKKGYHFKQEGDEASRMFLLSRGWAARYVILEDGQRQITELFLPGDMFPVHATMAGNKTDAIIALSDCEAVTCDPAELTNAAEGYPRLGRTLWWMAQREKEILKSWVANNNQRSAFTRLAYLFCELNRRAEQAGLGDDGTIAFPLTQNDLGAITGLTSVHINRTIQRLRSEGLVELSRKELVIQDQQRLQEISGILPDYLMRV